MYDHRRKVRSAVIVSWGDLKEHSDCISADNR